MQVREVRVEYGRTVNLGNYESERVLIGFTVTVDEDETWMGVVHDLGIQVKDTVEVQLRESERQRQAERQRRYRSADQAEQP